MKAFISFLVALTVLSGCVTTYKGPQPDFSKTGAEAKAEYEKFELGESYGEVNLFTARMGKQNYFTSSVEPIAKDVSPAWTTRLKRMEVGHWVLVGFLVATIATIFLPEDTWAHQTGYWIGLGGILGSGIYVNVTGMHAAEEYNRDLKSKFTPGLALSHSF